MQRGLAPSWILTHRRRRRRRPGGCSWSQQGHQRREQNGGATRQARQQTAPPHQRWEYCHITGGSSGRIRTSMIMIIIDGRNNSHQLGLYNSKRLALANNSKHTTWLVDVGSGNGCCYCHRHRTDEQTSRRNQEQVLYTVTVPKWRCGRCK